MVRYYTLLILMDEFFELSNSFFGQMQFVFMQDPLNSIMHSAFVLMNAELGKDKRLADSGLLLLGWLGELVFASWLLSDGAEHLSERWGGRFVGRTLLSIATTLPEIGIVVAAAKDGSYDIAIGSALGSNLF